MNKNIIEHGVLNNFIRPEHLTAQSLQTISSSFGDSEIGLVQIDNFLVQETAESCQKFLTNVAEYGELYGYTNNRQHTLNKEEWLAKPESERFFCYEMLKSDGSDHFNINALSFLKLRHFFESSAFKYFIQTIIQRELGKVTPVRVHQMKTGHFLKSHSDRGNNRDIAFILYLSSNWGDAYGGDLHIISRENKEHVIAPVFNKFLMFDVHQHKHHYLSEINTGSTDSQRKSRLSINGWFQKHCEEALSN